MTNPTLISTPFAADGDKSIINDNSGEAPNSATWEKGFPKITQTPITAGGIPPKRKDFNGVLNAISENIVHQTKGLGYEFDAAYAAKIGGYPLNARLTLSNGDIVRNTVAGNTTDPNIDMVGWVKANAASQIFDASGKSQQQINTSTLKKTYSLTDAGGIGGGSDDTAALNNAVSNNDRVYLDTDTSVIDQVVIKKRVDLYGGAELTQPNINKSTMYFGWQSTDPQFNTGEFVEKPIVTGVRYGLMGTATSDDFAALTFANVNAPINCLSHYRETENANRLSTSGGTLGKTGFGTRDALIFGNTYFHVRRFAVQILQASHSKIIGISSHNNGDNNFNNTGSGTNDGGQNVGIRLAGLGKGNIVGLSNLRDKYFNVTFQRGSEYNQVANCYFENSYENSINVNTSNTPAGLRNTVSDVVINGSGNTGVRVRYQGNSRFSGMISKTANLGIDADAYIQDNDTFLISFSGGSGALPAVGSTLTQGTVTCKVLEVRNESLQVVSSGNLPAKGTITVNTVTGGRLEQTVAFSEISATIDRVIAAEGRNRIDMTVTESTSSSARIQTSANLVDLISSNCETDDLILAGHYNIVRVAQSETKASRYSRVTGNYNIVLITDNEQSTAETSIQISGSNNIVIGATKGRISVTGSNNVLTVSAERVTTSGDNNDVGGQVSVIVDTGAGNKFSRVKNGSKSGLATLTTNANGQVTFVHSLAATAKFLDAKSSLTTGLYHITVANIAASATSSTLQVWNTDGTKAAAGVSISFYYSVSC